MMGDGGVGRLEAGKGWLTGGGGKSLTLIDGADGGLPVARDGDSGFSNIGEGVVNGGRPVITEGGTACPVIISGAGTILGIGGLFSRVGVGPGFSERHDGLILICECWKVPVGKGLFSILCNTGDDPL